MRKSRRSQLDSCQESDGLTRRIHERKRLSKLPNIILERHSANPLPTNLVCVRLARVYRLTGNMGLNVTANQIRRSEQCLSVLFINGIREKQRGDQMIQLTKEAATKDQRIQRNEDHAHVGSVEDKLLVRLQKLPIQSLFQTHQLSLPGRVYIVATDAAIPGLKRTETVAPLGRTYVFR